MSLAHKIKWVAPTVLMFLLVLSLLAPTVSASYLGPITTFLKSLINSIRIIGNSIAVVMFIYGAARYVYASDDPGGRKQAISICIASVVALIIIFIAESVIGAICASMGPDCNPVS